MVKRESIHGERSSGRPWQRVPPHGPSIFNNVFCTFCGCELGETVEAVNEHLVGRGFVPRGTLDGQWNLKTRACVPCNSRKGNLEDDISAITMQPDGMGRYVDRDPRLLRDSRRKGRGSNNRRTGRPVYKSNAETTIVHKRIEARKNPSAVSHQTRLSHEFTSSAKPRSVAFPQSPRCA